MCRPDAHAGYCHGQPLHKDEEGHASWLGECSLSKLLLSAGPSELLRIAVAHKNLASFYYALSLQVAGSSLCMAMGYLITGL